MYTDKLKLIKELEEQNAFLKAEIVEMMKDLPLLTPGRERLLQMVDIRGQEERKSTDPRIQMRGAARSARASAVLGRAIRPDAFNKEIADKAKKRFRSI